MQESARYGLAQAQVVLLSELKHPADRFCAIPPHCGSLRNRCGQGSALNHREEILF
jgi:hypothetical protein